jgi:hypothetical protein
MKKKPYQYYYNLLVIVIALTFSQPVLAKNKVQLGVGGGPIYGMIGLNGEILCFDRLGLTLGVGSITGLNCWTAGFRYYLNKSERRCRLRIGSVYGVVDYQFSGINDMEQKAVVKGFFPFIGADLKFSKNIGLNCDIGYRLPESKTTTLHGTENEYINLNEAIITNEKGVDFSLGLSYHF